MRDPFRVICGTSAGAINAVALAGGDSGCGITCSRLEQIWLSLRVEDIYRADILGMSRWMAGFARAIVVVTAQDPFRCWTIVRCGHCWMST